MGLIYYMYMLAPFSYKNAFACISEKNCQAAVVSNKNKQHKKKDNLKNI